MNEEEAKIAVTQVARLIITVTAGVLPGKPDPGLTRRYILTSEQWEQATDESGHAGDKGGQLLAELNGRAQGYAGLLMLQPAKLNWVRTEWIWL